jgi:hypothetical protein
MLFSVKGAAGKRMLFDMPFSAINHHVPPALSPGF